MAAPPRARRDELLVRVACHELRSAVAALRGFVSVLGDPAVDDVARSAAVGFVRANVDHLALTVDLLADGGLLAGPPTR